MVSCPAMSMVMRSSRSCLLVICRNIMENCHVSPHISPVLRVLAIVQRRALIEQLFCSSMQAGIPALYILLYICTPVGALIM